MKVKNWGNFPVIEADVRTFSCEADAAAVIREWSDLIPRGLGRCYGDSSLNARILSTENFNRILDFDKSMGLLTCESGVSLEKILTEFVPIGWFLSVTPGTKFVSVGGAIAADVHGKNHHSEGSFSRHIRSFRLMLSDGEVIECSRQLNADAFWATCGGMGLTGVILDATLCLKRIETSYIRQEVTKARNLDEIMRQFEESMDWTYSVAWIDCQAGKRSVGRSILNKGEFLTLEGNKSRRVASNPLKPHGSGLLTVPFNLPGWLLNPFTIRAFNFLYYHKQIKNRSRTVVHYDPFFYPLDGINHWNRGYGRRGFTQYQFVIPTETAYDGLRKVLEEIRSSRLGSPVTVLKRFGEQEGMLSFPMKGYTLALDFPITEKLWKFLDNLDEIVLNAGGRLYLSKDARMSRRMVEDGFPRLSEWRRIQQRLDTRKAMRSLQSQRVGTTT